MSSIFGDMDFEWSDTPSNTSSYSRERNESDLESVLSDYHTYVPRAVDINNSEKKKKGRPPKNKSSTSTSISTSTTPRERKTKKKAETSNALVSRTMLSNYVGEDTSNEKKKSVLQLSPDILPIMPGFKPIWAKITNISKQEYLETMANNIKQKKVSEGAKLMEFIVSCGVQFSSVLNDRAKVVLSGVINREDILSTTKYLYAVVKDKESKLLYQFSKDGKQSIKIMLLDNVSVLCKDMNALFGDNIIRKLEIRRNNERIVWQFNTASERNKWFETLTLKI